MADWHLQHQTSHFVLQLIQFQGQSDTLFISLQISDWLFNVNNINNRSDKLYIKILNYAVIWAWKCPINLSTEWAIITVDLYGSFRSRARAIFTLVSCFWATMFDLHTSKPNTVSTTRITGTRHTDILMYFTHYYTGKVTTSQTLQIHTLTSHK